jgi:D-arabinose 1-dehydrogenase-like Zn-dependent alcohol dehydrogenase
VKAARLVKRRHPLELVDLPDPAPGAGEVVISVDAEGICRTDWHVWNGDWDWVGLVPALPLVMGHELGGVPLPLDHIIESEIEITGSVGNPHVDYPRLLGLVETGVLRPARIVGQTLGLDQASEVLDAMDAYETLGFSVITGLRS